MRSKAEQRHKPRYGDKNPLDTHNLPRILADFPDARIVYIMRDPRPTVMSFNRMPFGTSSSLLNSGLVSDAVQPCRAFPRPHPGSPPGGSG